ncbi:MAG: FAD-binding domain [Woeseiaceae bacterium]
MKIVINGAGIAGPTLAYWLQQSGHDVLLVEEYPRFRGSGYVIDFWGLGYDIAERMSVIPRVRDLGYQVREVRFMDRQGDKAAGFSTDVFERMTDGRFTSLQRSDLAATIFNTVQDKVETIFGDSVAQIDERADGVRVGFDHAAPRDVDLVIGADGLHSRVRGLVFGSEDEFAFNLGYHVAAFAIKGYRPRDDLVYVSHAQPGRQISRFSMRGDATLFLFVFRDEYMSGEDPADELQHKSLLRRAFAGVGWECPRILDLMSGAGEVYFDRVSQIRMDRWSKGRTALVGDAAACVSLLAGEGCGLAMAEAYVLAGELNRAGGDHHRAFARYEERLTPFLKRKQESAARFATSFVPRTAIGIAFRRIATRLLRFPAVADYFIGRDLRDDVELPDYAAM